MLRPVALLGWGLARPGEARTDLAHLGGTYIGINPAADPGLSSGIGPCLLSTPENGPGPTTRLSAGKLWRPDRSQGGIRDEPTSVTGMQALVSSCVMDDVRSEYDRTPQNLRHASRNGRRRARAH